MRINREANAHSVIYMYVCIYIGKAQTITYICTHSIFFFNNYYVTFYLSLNFQFTTVSLIAVVIWYKYKLIFSFNATHLLIKCSSQQVSYTIYNVDSPEKHTCKIIEKVVGNRN